MGRSEIIDAIWGDQPPVTVTSSVYTYIAGLRKRLEPERPSRAPSNILRSTSSGYMLRVEPADVDTLAFDRHLSNAKAMRAMGATEKAVENFHEALRMWQDPLPLWHAQPLGGAPGPYAAEERARLNELRYTAVEEWADLLFSLDRPAEAIGELTALTRGQPLRERARWLLILAFYRCGRQADALREFRDVRQTLDTELGIEPCEALQVLHQQILRGDPDLLPSGRSPLELTTPADSRVIPAQLPRDLPDLTGRSEELEHLRTLARSWESGSAAGLIQVTGPHGIGKTALAVHFAHGEAEHFPDGQLYVDLDSSGTGSTPRRARDALPDILTELGWKGELPASLERRTSLYRTMVAGRRMLIILKDAVSAEDVRELLPGSPSCLVIVTSQAEMTSLTVRERAPHLNLDVLPPDDAVQLVKSALGERYTGDADGVEELARACDFRPAALLEAVEHLTARSVQSEGEPLRRQDSTFFRVGTFPNPAPPSPSSVSKEI